MVVKQKRRTIKKKSGKKVNRTQKGGSGRRIRQRRIHPLTRYLHSRGMLPKLTKNNISGPFNIRPLKLSRNIDKAVRNKQIFNNAITRANFRRAVDRFNNWQEKKYTLLREVIKNAEDQTGRKLSSKSEINIYLKAKNPTLSEYDLIPIVQEGIRNNRKREANEQHGYIEVKPNN